MKMIFVTVGLLLLVSCSISKEAELLIKKITDERKRMELQREQILNQAAENDRKIDSLLTIINRKVK